MFKMNSRSHLKIFGSALAIGLMAMSLSAGASVTKLPKSDLWIGPYTQVPLTAGPKIDRNFPDSSDCLVALEDFKSCEVCAVGVAESDATTALKAVVETWHKDYGWDLKIENAPKITDIKPALRYPGGTALFNARACGIVSSSKPSRR